MRRAMSLDPTDLNFDLPPHFAVLERRMAGQALDCWATNRHRFVAGFANNSLVITDPFGAAVIDSAGPAVSATFGLAAGMCLDARTGLAAELRAACDIIALDPVPCPFEASLESPGHACILVRGIALPLTGQVPERVQIIVNWRELLNRSASARLRREIGAALRQVRAQSRRADPFGPEFGPKPLA